MAAAEAFTKPGLAISMNAFKTRVILSEAEALRSAVEGSLSISEGECGAECEYVVAPATAPKK
jgi:hypothetical protein